MRKYSEDRHSEAKLDHLPGYPRMIPGTSLQHTVMSLSKTVSVGSDLSVMLNWYISTEGEVPLEIKFVAGNTANCRTSHTIQAFFTREGGKTLLPLQLLLCDSSSSPSILLFPSHDVVVVRLNDTTMIVSFRKLTIMEAKSLHVAYYISYSSYTSRKSRASRAPDGTNSAIVADLDLNSDYDVSMYATPSVGQCYPS